MRSCMSAVNWVNVNICFAGRLAFLVILGGSAAVVHWLCLIDYNTTSWKTLCYQTSKRNEVKSKTNSWHVFLFLSRSKVVVCLIVVVIVLIYSFPKWNKSIKNTYQINWATELKTRKGNIFDCFCHIQRTTNLCSFKLIVHVYLSAFCW